MASGSPTTLDEFKARLPLVEVIGRYVRLTRRGREHVGLCPFHREKTPSFTVSEAKGFYYCFGCGQTGNAIDFVMAQEGLEFGPALARLEELTGIPAPAQRSSGPRVDRALYAANEAAQRWFAGRLASGQGKAAADYLDRRGLHAETIARFGLGYAPDDRGALKRALLAEGYDDDQLTAAGLVIRPEDGSASYDRFRGRVMFPIHDRQGRIAGFGGRALGEARAKYLNTPDTDAFHKGGLLYGLNLAQRAARDAGSVIVAEGYIDVIALAQAGFAHAVAPLGTAITEAQLGLLWQLADEPIVCLDGDEAGARAAHRLLERALPLLRPAKSLRFALLPPGQDPDSLLREAGAAALAQCLDGALPLIDFLWQAEIAGRSLATPERRAGLRRRLRELARTIEDRDLARLFQQALDQRLRAQFEAGDRRRPGAPDRSYQAPQSGVGAHRLAAALGHPERRAEQELLAPILHHPELLAEIEEELAALIFVDSDCDGLREAILSWYGEVEHLDPNGLKSHLCQIGLASLVGQLMVDGTPPAWFGRALDRQEALAGWRARAAERRRFMERRGLGDAYAAAITGEREREAGAHRIAVNRLLNPNPSPNPSDATVDVPVKPDRDWRT